MNPTFENLKQVLRNKNIKLSPQRLKILEFLAFHRCHPSVDQIYKSLQKDLSILSKTTIYNTLKTLSAAGLVRVITIEDNETRYDIVTENHGHFKCESCGVIIDFPIDIDSFIPEVLNNYKINDKNVYFKGLCPRCNSKINETK